MAEEKKKKSFLSRLGFKSKDDKRAEEVMQAIDSLDSLDNVADFARLLV